MLPPTTIFQQLPPCTRYFIGYSGGVDSHVLLDICVQWWQAGLILQPQPVHIHHGLSPNADAWAKHCETICKNYALSCQIIHVDAKAKAQQSPEEVARQARYDAFISLLKSGDGLLVAHHQRDQAETFLLQLFRGAGVKGLAAMPEQRALGLGLLLRPLLSCEYEDILHYARQKQLQWIEDESNQNLSYQRNSIRHNVLPLLQHYFPSAIATISRSAENCAQADYLLTELAKLDFEQVQGSEINTLSVQMLQQLSTARRDNVVRFWLYEHYDISPSRAQLEQFNQLFSASDAQPQLHIHTIVIRRHKDNIFALPNQPSNNNASLVINWDILNNDSLKLPQSLGLLKTKKINGGGLSINRLKDHSITIRFRQGGERCQPVGRMGSHPLKKCLQEAGIPSWQRAKIPLLYIGDNLALVVGLWICEGFMASNTEDGIEISLIDNP